MKNQSKNLHKTPSYRILAQCIWEVLDFLEKNGGGTAIGLEDLHNELRPRLEFLLRKQHREQEVLWPDDDQHSSEPATSNSGGHAKPPGRS